MATVAANIRPMTTVAADIRHGDNIRPMATVTADIQRMATTSDQWRLWQLTFNQWLQHPADGDCGS